MSGRMIWKNGEIRPESEAVYSVYDEAMMFGTCVFEMQRTFRKQTFKLWEHLERLFTSMKILEIDTKYDFEYLFNAHENLIIHNRHCFSEDDEVRTLINVSRGLLPIYESMGSMEPNIIIATFPLRIVTKGMSRFYKQGVSAIIPSQRAIPESLLDPKIKSRSRQHLQVANLEVKRQDSEAWPLMLDPDGFVAESTGANFFIIKENTFELITPEPRNILRGVTRGYVMNLARKLGLEVIEKNISLYDVYQAREAFFTCTPFSIMPCTRINGKMIGEGKVGRRTQHLMRKFIEDVGVDFVAQAEAWDKAS